ncbi:MAG TPA: DUF3095 family protein [Stellaceae bacterium]|jgi:hypothetical protein|nr:DUF3095 family protein [Stellaceae bacterium]
MPQNFCEASFYQALPACRSIEEIFDHGRYGAVPGDWLVAVSDVENSTRAIEAGRQKSVNFAGAAAIAALKNLCLPETIPFQFGGDGAAILVPPTHAQAARVELARTRRFVTETYGLNLRAGAASVAELREHGATILLGRHQPSPGNAFAVFLGDGIDRLEAAVKGRGDPALAAIASIPSTLDDGAPPDFTGLSCRWAPLASQKGRMMALLVQGDIDQGQLYTDLRRLAGDPSELRAAARANLKTRWPPDTTWLEVRAIQGKGLLVKALARVLVGSLLAKLLIRLDLALGPFNPRTYVRGLIVNTDVPKRGRTLALVFDCPADGVDAIRAYLDERSTRGELVYGMQLSDVALMTCLVTSLPEDRHVHFIDGGSGGYTFAARELKAKLAALAPIST